MIQLWYNHDQDSVGVILTYLPSVSLPELAIYSSDMIEHDQIISKHSEWCGFSCPETERFSTLPSN